MKEYDKKYLLELANELDIMERMGDERDIPEGRRYIQISDTLAMLISKKFREIANANI